MRDSDREGVLAGYGGFYLHSLSPSSVSKSSLLFLSEFLLPVIGTSGSHSECAASMSIMEMQVSMPDSDFYHGCLLTYRLSDANTIHTTLHLTLLHSNSTLSIPKNIAGRSGGLGVRSNAQIQPLTFLIFLS